MFKQLALGLGFLMVVPGSVVWAHAEARPTAPGPETHYDEKRGVAYSVSYTADGGIQLSAQSPELQFQKTSYQDGHYQLRLVAQDDSVVFEVSASGVQVTRGASTAALAVGAAVEADFDRARVVLAGSRAVKRYRQLAAALEQSDDDSATSQSTLIGAALVGLLDGDAGAPARIARRLAGKKAAGLKKISLSEDCWVTYSERVYQASNDFFYCIGSATWWNYDLMSYMCSMTWMIRVEGYWFQYIACSAIPLQFGD